MTAATSVPSIDLTRVRLSFADFDAPWLECMIPGCGWSSETDPQHGPDALTNTTVGRVAAIAEQHLDTHREGT